MDQRAESCRTQWMNRLVAFADQHQLTLQLAYYPPYHSKYNPVECVWGGFGATLEWLLA